jgi:hypothetical protein
MSQSNIFVYTELSKLTAVLSDNTGESKKQLKSQAGYFNIITAKYFSTALSGEWETITGQIKIKGPKLGSDGKVVTNAIVNTIDQMSPQECSAITSRILSLYEKVKLEFEK